MIIGGNMRIIDKNNDYYDYLNDNEDTLVFDRRGSRELTRREIIYIINLVMDSYYKEPNIFMVLQCGATYWLLFAEGIDIRKDEFYLKETAHDYRLSVLCTWKDYDHPIKLLSLQTIMFNEMWKYNLYKIEHHKQKIIRTLLWEEIVKATPKLQEAVIHKEYRVYDDFSTKGYLLLKATGIPNLIGPEVMYNAIDEYFSLMKTAAESTVAEGTTNNDKIKNHGFDTKTSFRGKV